MNTCDIQSVWVGLTLSEMTPLVIPGVCLGRFTLTSGRGDSGFR